MDNWKTPLWLMEIFNPSKFTDRCPSNHLNDSLKDDWLSDSYVNPPYSNPLPFVLKGIEEHKKHKTRIIFLLKLDPTTKWYRALLEADAHILFFSERLYYGDQVNYATFPSVLAILSD